MADLIVQRSRPERLDHTTDAGSANDRRASGLLQEEYTIDTPENVTFGYAVAGIGSRFIGALIDTLLIGALLLLVNFVLFAALSAANGLPFGMAEWAEGLLVALYALLNFAIIWGYYLLFELLWRGQTPGKRGAGTRVIAVGGGPATFLEVAIRNLVRIVDFLPFAYALGLVTMLLNRQARRLGDFAAGTLVVKPRGAVTLAALGQGTPGVAVAESMTVATPAPEAAPMPVTAGVAYPYLRRLTGADYQVICTTLARFDRGAASPVLLRRLTVAIAARLQTTPPAVYDPVINRRFLAAVADAYRSQTPHTPDNP